MDRERWPAHPDVDPAKVRSCVAAIAMTTDNTWIISGYVHACNKLVCLTLSSGSTNHASSGWVEYRQVASVLLGWAEDHGKTDEDATMICYAHSMVMNSIYRRSTFVPPEDAVTTQDCSKEEKMSAQFVPADWQQFQMGAVMSYGKVNAVARISPSKSIVKISLQAEGKEDKEWHTFSEHREWLDYQDVDQVYAGWKEQHGVTDEDKKNFDDLLAALKQTFIECGPPALEDDSGEGS